jgi:hypothetical protein
MEWSFQFVFGTSSTTHSSTTGFYTDRPQTAAVQKRQQDKPFDALAERVVSKDSRGDWTPLELFLAEVRGWEARLACKLRRLQRCSPKQESPSTFLPKGFFLKIVEATGHR